MHAVETKHVLSLTLQEIVTDFGLDGLSVRYIRYLILQIEWKDTILIDNWNDNLLFTSKFMKILLIF